MAQELRIDRHSPDQCEVEGCERSQEHEMYVGREGHRVDVCYYHAVLINEGWTVIGA